MLENSVDVPLSVSMDVTDDSPSKDRVRDSQAKRAYYKALGGIICKIRVLVALACCCE